MTILNRPDGTQFVVQAYRERLTLDKRSALVQKIRNLAADHGQYLLLWPMPQHSLEVIFSKEPGYLLGESIWSHFEQPANLIFCERLSKDHNQVLLIVIRDNEVYLDTQVENDKVKSELLPLMTSAQPFRVVVSGEVSLTVESFPDKMASSFEVVKESLIKQLPALNKCRLSSLALILKSPLLGSRLTPLNLAAAAFVVLGFAWGAYIYMSKPESMPTPSLATPSANAQEVDPYADFYAALTTPPPSEQLQELAQAVIQLYDLPSGWQTGSIHFENKNYHLILKRQGGSVQEMTDWTKQYNYSFDLGPQGAQVALPSQLYNRGVPRVIYSLPQVMASLIDQLDPLFQESAVTVGEVKQLGNVKSRTLTINLKDISPQILPMIGNTLGEDLPLSVTAIDVNVNAGLLSGTIQLSAWGI